MPESGSFWEEQKSQHPPTPPTLPTRPRVRSNVEGRGGRVFE